MTIVFILSYLAAWFIGALSVVAILAHLVKRDERQRKADLEDLLDKLDSTGATPKPGPILIDKPGPNPFTE